MFDGNHPETFRAPGQQDIDGWMGAAIVGECITKIGAKDPESADIAGYLNIHHASQCHFGNLRSQVPQQAMLLGPGGTVNSVISFVQFLKKLGNLFRRVLQVVINSNDNIVPGGANTS